MLSSLVCSLRLSAAGISCCLILLFASFAEGKEQQPLLERPLMERYVLDELKSLRVDQERLRTDMTAMVTEAKLSTADRAMRYTTDTVNNIFFIITAAASILVLAGWNSLREARSRIDEVIQAKVATIGEEYEQRLRDVESKLKKRSEQILVAQDEIAKANQIHALWMRAGLETSHQEKIKLYDEIIALKPDDLEALTYKADAVLDLGESEWALNLSNRAIELDDSYGLAYWQRACARVALGLHEEAMEDIESALERSPSLRSELTSEPAFESLRQHDRFQLISSVG